MNFARSNTRGPLGNLGGVAQTVKQAPPPSPSLTLQPRPNQFKLFTSSHKWPHSPYRDFGIPSNFSAISERWTSLVPPWMVEPSPRRM